MVVMMMVFGVEGYGQLTCQSASRMDKQHVNPLWWSVSSARVSHGPNVSFLGGAAGCRPRGEVVGHQLSPACDGLSEACFS